jgi:hypothetical protein
LPLKSIKQKFTPNTDQIKMMNTFKDMVNHCIRIGQLGRQEAVPMDTEKEACVEGKRIISEEEYLQHQVVPQPDAPFTILD